MSMKAFVAQGSDALIVDVTGADPNSTQTADVQLWSGRSPAASASGGIGTLATAPIEADSTTTMTVRNPWPGQPGRGWQ